MKQYLSIAVLLFIATVSAPAQVITAGTTPFTIISSTTAAPGDTTDFDYFTYTTPSPASNPSTLTNFSVSPTAPANYYSTTLFTSAEDPTGTAFVTGSFYETPFETTQTSDIPLLSFQVTNPLETSFNVFVLTNNANVGNEVNEASYTLSSSGSSSTATINSGSNEFVDEYLEFSVTGANTSEVFTLGGTPAFDGTHDGSGVGGITFQDVTAVPEASTWVMMLGGLVLLFVVHHRRAVGSV